MVTALAVTRDLEPGTELSDEMLTEVAFPEKHLPPGVGTDRSEFVGKVIGRAIPSQMLIYPADLVPEDSPLSVQARIPAGMRAYTIPLNSASAGLAGFAVPGSRVDVLSSPPTNRNEIAGQSEVVVENVQILAVDNASSSKDMPANPKHMTLLVSQQQARRVDQAQLHGALRISLRNVSDLQTAEAERSSPIETPAEPRRVRLIPITIVRHNEATMFIAKSRSGQPKQSGSSAEPAQIGQLGSR